MRATFQLCLALLCAMGAGLSGDLYSHYSGHVRHATSQGAPQHRGSRTFGRDGHIEAAHEPEVLITANHQAAVASNAATPRLIAVLPAFVAKLRVHFFQTGVELPALPGFVLFSELRALSARGPPSLG